MVIMIYMNGPGLTFMYHKCQLSMSIYIMLPHCGYVSIWTYVSQTKKYKKINLKKRRNRTNIFSATSPSRDRPTQKSFSSRSDPLLIQRDMYLWDPGITSIYNIIFALTVRCGCRWFVGVSSNVLPPVHFVSIPIRSLRLFVIRI